MKMFNNLKKAAKNIITPNFQKNLILLFPKINEEQERNDALKKTVLNPLIKMKEKQNTIEDFKFATISVNINDNETTLTIVFRNNQILNIKIPSQDMAIIPVKEKTIKGENGENTTVQDHPLIYLLRDNAIIEFISEELKKDNAVSNVIGDMSGKSNAIMQNDSTPQTPDSDDMERTNTGPEQPEQTSPETPQTLIISLPENTTDIDIPIAELVTIEAAKKVDSDDSQDILEYFNIKIKTIEGERVDRIKIINELGMLKTILEEQTTFPKTEVGNMDADGFYTHLVSYRIAIAQYQKLPQIIQEKINKNSALEFIISVNAAYKAHNICTQKGYIDVLPDTMMLAIASCDNQYFNNIFRSLSNAIESIRSIDTTEENIKEMLEKWEAHAHEINVIPIVRMIGFWNRITQAVQTVAENINNANFPADLIVANDFAMQANETIEQWKSRAMKLVEKISTAQKIIQRRNISISRSPEDTFHEVRKNFKNALNTSIKKEKEKKLAEALHQKRNDLSDQLRETYNVTPATGEDDEVIATMEAFLAFVQKSQNALSRLGYDDSTITTHTSEHEISIAQKTEQVEKMIEDANNAHNTKNEISKLITSIESLLPENAGKTDTQSKDWTTMENLHTEIPAFYSQNPAINAQYYGKYKDRLQTVKQGIQAQTLSAESTLDQLEKMATGVNIDAMQAIINAAVQAAITPLQQQITEQAQQLAEQQEKSKAQADVITEMQEKLLELQNNAKQVQKFIQEITVDNES